METVTPSGVILPRGDLGLPGRGGIPISALAPGPVGSILRSDSPTGSPPVWRPLPAIGTQDIIPGIEGQRLGVDQTHAPQAAWDDVGSSVRNQGCANTLVSGTSTLLTWTSTTFVDTRYFIAISTGIRFVAPANGANALILLGYTLLFATAAAPVGGREALLFAGGSQIQWSAVAANPRTNAPTGVTGILVTITSPGTTTDFSIQGLHTQGANLGFVNDLRTNFFAVYLGNAHT